MVKFINVISLKFLNDLNLKLVKYIKRVEIVWNKLVIYVYIL